MGFKLKSGNTTSFKTMGGTEKSPAKDMKTGKYEHSFESPAKQKRAPKPVKPGEKPIAVKNIPWESKYKDAIDAWKNQKSDTTKTKEKKKSPAKQTDTTWADGSKKSKRQIEEQKIHPSEYWYKINGKKATKAEYIKYQNKPGGDEPGKQTNDPTVSLAKQSADKRIKINK